MRPPIIVAIVTIVSTTLFILSRVSFDKLFTSHVDKLVSNESNLEAVNNDQNISTTNNENVNKKILILTYSRSGSSLLGELLSLPESTTYYYEPLLKFSSDCGQRFNISGRWPDVERFIGGLLTCSPDAVNQISKFSQVHNKNKNCQSVDNIIIKTIRMRRGTVEEILKFIPDLKIVHLVRDPRDQTSSRMHGPFNCENKDLEAYCRAIFDDLQLQHSVKYPGQYIRIRYEDLVDNPLVEMTNLYDSLGLHLSEDISSKIAKHFNAESAKNNGKYYGLYKTKKFKAKRPLNSHWTNKVETNCKDFMNVTRYLNI